MFGARSRSRSRSIDGGSAASDAGTSVQSPTPANARAAGAGADVDDGGDSTALVGVPVQSSVYLQGCDMEALAAQAVALSLSEGGKTPGDAAVHDPLCAPLLQLFAAFEARDAAAAAAAAAMHPQAASGVASTATVAPTFHVSSSLPVVVAEPDSDLVRPRRALCVYAAHSLSSLVVFRLPLSLSPCASLSLVSRHASVTLCPHVRSYFPPRRTLTNACVVLLLCSHLLTSSAPRCRHCHWCPAEPAQRRRCRRRALYPTAVSAVVSCAARG